MIKKIEELRAAAGDALAAIGPEAAPALAPAEALGKLGPAAKAAAFALEAAKSDPNPEVREAAAAAARAVAG